jgi:membrane protease YdiL (CAAX protease family)
VLGYAVWRSGSLYCSILIHALNNGLIVTIAWANGGKELGFQTVPWSLTFGALAIMALGLLLLAPRPDQSPSPSRMR